MIQDNTTPFPNEVLDELDPILKPVERMVLHRIIRQTWGWNKEEDWISLGQFVKRTDASRKAIAKALIVLNEKGTIAIEDRGGRTYYRYAYRERIKKDGKRFQNEGKTFPLLGKNIPPSTKDTLTKNTVTRENISQEQNQARTKQKRKEVADYLKNNVF